MFNIGEEYSDGKTYQLLTTKAEQNSNLLSDSYFNTFDGLRKKYGLSNNYSLTNGRQFSI